MDVLRSKVQSQIFCVIAIWCSSIGSAPAIACSCEFPDIGYLAEESIEVPGNAKGILWSGVVRSSNGLVEFPPIENFCIQVRNGEKWDPLAVRLNLYRDIHGISDSPFDVFLVGPEEGLVRGGNYRFVFFAREARSLGGISKATALDSQVVDVAVSEEDFHGEIMRRNSAPLEVGKLRIANGSSCSHKVEAQWVDVEHILPPELRKWEDSLYYSVVRFNRYWHPRSSMCELLPPGRSWVGTGKARLYHLTEPSSQNFAESGLPANAKTAMFYAKLPGTPEIYRVRLYLPFGDTE